MKSLKDLDLNNDSLHLLRRTGAFFSSIIMPNLSVFIALGIINIITNFVQGNILDVLQMIEVILMNYLLPLLISYTGGRQVEASNGGIVASISALGIIAVNSDYSILGAMLIGPSAAICYSYLNKKMIPKVKNGYEMLFHTVFSGLCGITFCLISLFVLSPVLKLFSELAISGVLWLAIHHLLPIINIFLEPLKVLFFNNSINHGVLTPLGLTMVNNTGKSILFLLETNPGPGFGVLLACYLSSNFKEKNNAKSALFIQLFGGIHEVYFPFVLKEPKLFISIILSGVTGTAIFNWFNVGLTRPVSPGSIILILMNANKNDVIGILLGIIVSGLLSFLSAYYFLNHHYLDKSSKKSKAIVKEDVNVGMIEKIIVACDAGIGSSAMGASLLKKSFQERNDSIEIDNQSVYQVENNPKHLVLIHPQLKQELLKVAPDTQILEINNFLAVEETIHLIDNYMNNIEINQKSSKEIKKVLEIVLLFDNNVRGSQTMAIELMNNRAKQNGTYLKIRKEAIETAILKENVLYIVSTDFYEKHRLDNSDLTIFVMSDLLKMSEFDQWLKGV